MPVATPDTSIKTCAKCGRTGRQRFHKTRGGKWNCDNEHACGLRVVEAKAKKASAKTSKKASTNGAKKAPAKKAPAKRASAKK